MNNQSEEPVLKLNEAKKTLPKLAAEDILVFARDKIKMTDKTFSSFKRNLEGNLKLQKLVLNYNKEYARLKNILDNIDKVNIQKDSNTTDLASDLVNTKESPKAVNDTVNRLATLLVEIHEDVQKTRLKSGVQARAIKIPPFIPKKLVSIYKYFKKNKLLKQRKEMFKEELKKVIQGATHENTIMPLIVFSNSELELMKAKQKELDEQERLEKERSARLASSRIEDGIREVAVKKLGVPTKEELDIARKGLDNDDSTHQAILRLAIGKKQDPATKEQAKRAEEGLAQSKRVLEGPDKSITPAILDIAKLKRRKLEDTNTVEEHRKEVREEARNITEASGYLKTFIDERNYYSECGYPELAQRFDEYIKKQTTVLSNLMGVDLESLIEKTPETIKEDKVQDNAVDPVAHEKRLEDLNHAFVGPEADEMFRNREEFAHFQALAESSAASGMPVTAQEVLESARSNSYIGDVYDEAEKQSSNNTAVIDIQPSAVIPNNTGNEQKQVEPVSNNGDVPVPPHILNMLLGDILKADSEKENLAKQNIPVDFLIQRLQDAKDKGDIILSPSVLIALVRNYLDTNEKIGSTVVPEAVKKERILEARMQENVPQADLDKRVQEHNLNDAGSKEVPVSMLDARVNDATAKDKVEEQRMLEEEAARHIISVQSEYEASIDQAEDAMEQNIQEFADKQKLEYDKFVEARRKTYEANVKKVKSIIDPEGKMSSEDFDNWLAEERKLLRENATYAKVKDEVLNNLIVYDRSTNPSQGDVILPQGVIATPVVNKTENPIVKQEEVSVSSAPVKPADVKNKENNNIRIFILPARYSRVTADSKPIKTPKKVPIALNKASQSAISNEKYAQSMNPYNNDPVVQAERMAIHDEMMNGEVMGYTKRNQDYMNEVFNDPSNKEKLDKAEYDTELTVGLSSVASETPEEKRAYVDSLQKIKDLQQEYNNSFVYAGRIPTIDANVDNVQESATPIKK